MNSQNTPPYNNCDYITLAGLIDDIVTAQDTELITHASDAVCWPCNNYEAAPAESLQPDVPQ